ncbi:glycosyl hydrolase [Parapedobacter pyrenivorans]|uniref:Glycosyl hydrolase n=2 Tax=Parapedobacter pyrenivorans TaxID=1305674 RepID=A0A917MDN7_9SPHI|nr:glycosyl hydrolase [Parapedobacter pyrenivorans]
MVQLVAAQVERVEPLHWWAGMSNPDVQLLVYGEQLADKVVSIDYPGVQLIKTHRPENPNYLFLDLRIATAAKPGVFPIRFTETGTEAIVYHYELKARDPELHRLQGVNTSDLIYLIMPDRFANGDDGNDIVPNLHETALNRDSLYYRHGGDLQGIIDHLDYLEELGVTALWLNPVLTNDQPTTSYHGYANTENYEIDPRFGGNEAYRKLIDACHNRGMKVVKDLVHNHFGTNHYTVRDLPMPDWVHEWPAYTKTNYREQVHMDPYASKADRVVMVDGWFDKQMADMNHQNPFVRNYITQSHIWWIEEMGVDGFRLDTYAYNDLDYMAEWATKITEEYPRMTFFGETWVHGVPNQAFFTTGNRINQGVDTGLQGVTDFQGLWAIYEALNGKFGWMDGVVRLYNTLANDFMYEDPSRNVVFLDNHDLSRFYSVVGEDDLKFRSGIAWLLTTRGIPQLYYGTEILMKNYANPDGLVREDFPGGWKGDRVDKFTASGRSAAENEAFDYVKKLANYRKQHAVLHTGKLLQFIPENGVYVYFRYDEQATVMVIMNSNAEAVTLDTERFAEGLRGRRGAVNVVTDEVLTDIGRIAVPATTTMVLELR